MSSIEEGLVRIWCDLLGKSHVDLNQDFFEVGGTSLLLLDMLSRIKNEFGADVSFRLLLKGFSVTTLANEIADCVPGGAVAGS